MKRRNFIKSCAITAAGTLLMPNALSPKLFGATQELAFVPLKGAWKLNNDGTFDFYTSQITLKGAFPSFDGKTIRPINVKVERKGGGGRIVYTLTQGKVTLTFGEKEGLLSLDSSLEGIGVTPHWFAPMSEATIEGADRYFKQGAGFAGPSGVFKYLAPPVRRETPQTVL
jgi:hypothetical protein